MAPPSSAERPRHIGLIPARAGSKGIPGKNRYLFCLTAEFIHRSGLFDHVVVASDDEVLLQLGAAEGFEVRRRPAGLAGDDTSLKLVFEDVVANTNIGSGDYVWSLLIPLVYKSVDDFAWAKAIVDEKRPSSLCSFVRAQSHPYYCWRFDEEAGRIERFIEHDVHRRQDLPEAWLEYQYLCCLRADSVAGCNSNLIRNDTYPVKLSADQFGRLVDVDTPEDFAVWRRRQPVLFDYWLGRLPAEVSLPGLERKDKLVG